MYLKYLKKLSLTLIFAVTAALFFAPIYGYAADFEGKPKIRGDATYGYYLWRDKKDMWHLTTLSNDTIHTFSGEILLTKGRFEVVEKESGGIIEKIFDLFSNTLERDIKKEAKKKRDKDKEEEGIAEDKTINLGGKNKGKKSKGGNDDKIIRDRLAEGDVIVVNDRKIVFSFQSKDEERSFGFKVKGTSPCVKFDLKIDGKRRIRKIYLGEHRVRPRRLPFHRCR